MRRPEAPPPEADLGSVDAVGSVASIAEPASLDEHAPRAPTAAHDDTDQASGRYRVGREIGAGAMGRVSLVRDLRLLRDVAWKQGDGRILREARILAQLEHPGIVPIYDMGFDADDEPFFAMRVVSGRSFSKVLAETAPAQRTSLLRPLLQAAEAVAFAHHRGVVHRDLKPANVMVGAFGETQVVDWGLARVLDDATVPIPAEVRLALARSEAGRVGTPGYMSPEQEAGRPADRRSDVFALGRMLGDVLGPAPPELVAIAERATAPDPATRYPDAAAFAADLARYLDGARVHAHTYGPRELLRRFVRAYRIPLVVALVGLVALGVLLARYIVDIGAQRERAEGAETEVRRALSRSDRFLARALVGESRRVAADGLRAEAELLAAHALTLGEDPDARALVASFAGAPALELRSRAPAPCPDAQVDPVNGDLLCARFDGVSLWRPHGDGFTRAWSVPFAHHVARFVDGGVVLGGMLGILLLDRDGHTLLRTNAPNNPSGRTTAAGAIAVLEGNFTSVLVDLARRVVTGVKPCVGRLHAAVVAPGPAFAIDAPVLPAALCKDGTLEVEGRGVPTPLVAPEREGVRMAPLADGRFVVGTNKGEVVILDGDGTLGVGVAVVDGMVRLLAPSPDGRFVLVAGEGDPIEILSLPELASIASLPRRAKTAAWVPASAGDLVTTGDAIEHWHLAPADAGRPLRGAYRIPMRDGLVALEADGDTLLAANGPHVAVIGPDQRRDASPGFVTIKGLGLANGALVVAGTYPPGFLRLDPRTLDAVAPPRALAVRRLVSLADGTLLVASYMTLERVDGDVFTTVEPEAALDLSVAPGRRFALMLRERDHALLRFAMDSAASELVGFDPLALAVAIASDGERLFTARTDEVAAWDTTGDLVQVYRADGALLLDVEVSNDGRWVAAGARDGAVFLWHTGEPTPRARFLDHHERVPALAFSRDSRWLASGSWDRTVRVRDLAVVDRAAAELRAELSARYGLELPEALGGAAIDARL